MSILENMISEGINTFGGSGFQVSEKNLVGREDLIQPMMIRDGDTLNLELIYELLACYKSALSVRNGDVYYISYIHQRQPR